MKPLKTNPVAKFDAFKIVTVLALILSIISIVLFFRKPEKVAFVNTGVVLDSYQGMIDARAQFKKKSEVWQNNADTLTSDLQRSLMEYEKKIASMNPREKKLNEEVLQNKQKQLVQYQQATQKMAQEEEAKLTRGPLNQINSFISDYGKSNHYKFIFGTANGNLLFADTTLNLTDVIVTGLNSEYKVGKK